MYGVMNPEKRIIHYVATLEKAKELRDEMIKKNEFYFRLLNIYGGYKIVKIHIEEITEENINTRSIADEI